MTEQELRALRRPKPEDAAKYLGGGINAQHIRIMAQQGRCPYCVALKRPGGRRYIYNIYVEALIKCKHEGLLFQPAG